MNFLPMIKHNVEVYSFKNPNGKWGYVVARQTDHRSQELFTSPSKYDTATEAETEGEGLVRIAKEWNFNTSTTK